METKINSSITEEQFKAALTVIEAYRKDHRAQDEEDMKKAMNENATGLGESEDQLVDAMLRSLEIEEQSWNSPRAGSKDSDLSVISNIFSTMHFYWGAGEGYYNRKRVPNYKAIKEEIAGQLSLTYRNGFKQLYDQIFDLHNRYSDKPYEDIVEQALSDFQGYTFETGWFRYRYIIDKDDSQPQPMYREGLTVEFIPVHTKKLIQTLLDTEKIQAIAKIESRRQNTWQNGCCCCECGW